MGESRRRRAAACTVAVAVAATAAGCSLGGPSRDRVAEAALAQLTQALDDRLSGAQVPDRAALTAHVRAAYPDVVQSPSGAKLRYAILEGKGQELADDVPVALALWESRTGADPFTDDVPRWHLHCAQLSVDQGKAALQASQVRCPGGTPEAPADTWDLLPLSPVLDHEAPDDGTLLVGQPARSGVPGGLRRSATRSAAPYPCAQEDMAATLEQLTTAGNTDDATLRIVNTSAVACEVRGPLRLVAERGPQDTSTTGPTTQAAVALAPRESLTAAVSWRPSQKVSADPQRITVSVSSDELPVRIGAGLSLAPIKADEGPTLVVGPWQVSGYGPLTDDHSPTVDIAAPCVADNLAALTQSTGSSSGDDAAPAPTVTVINLGVTTCRFGRGDLPAFQDLTGLSPFAPAPVTVLRPGDQVAAPVTGAVEHRADQLLVAGRWVPTVPTNGPTAP